MNIKFNTSRTWIRDLKRRNRRLTAQYPFLQIKDSFNRPIKAITTWDDYLLAGWKKSFGNKMWHDLKIILQKHDYVDKFIILNIHDCYGVICFTYAPVPEELSKDLIQWEHYYRGECMVHCRICGEWTTKWAAGQYLCEHCSDHFFSPRDLTWKDVPKKFAADDLSDPVATTEIIEHPLADVMKKHWLKDEE